MSQSQFNEKLLADNLEALGYKFICGKWFDKDDKWIKNIYSEIQDKVYTNLRDKQTDMVIASFIRRKAKLERWPKSEVIAKANLWIKQGKLRDMCYDLTEEHLIILNQILLSNSAHFFIFYGKAKTGKSTVINLFARIIGQEEAVPLPLTQLNEDFKIATCVGARLVYDHEISQDEIDDNMIKRLTDKTKMTINGKNQQVYQSIFQASLLYGCNEPPRFNILDVGIQRRIIYYKMNNVITNVIPNIEETWTEDDLINIAAHALLVDTTDWEKRFEKETREVLVQNTSTYIFRECNQYEDYVDRVKKANLKPYSLITWEKQRQLLKDWGFIDSTGVKSDSDLKATLAQYSLEQILSNYSVSEILDALNHM